MKRTEKVIGFSLIGILAVAALCLSLTSNAENVGLGIGTPSSFSQSVAPGITGTVTGQFTVADATKFAISITTTSAAACTSNTTVTVERSLDGNNWLAYSTMKIANTGSTTAYCISNYTGQADVLIRCYVDNGMTNSGVLITNYVTVGFNKLKF